jgi:S1-C subfamily serine protease
VAEKFNQTLRFVRTAAKNYENKEEVHSLENSQKQNMTRFYIALIVAALLVGAVAGGLIGYSVFSKQIDDLRNQVSAQQEQISRFQSTQDVTNENVTYILGENASLTLLYEKVKDSVVTIESVSVQYDIFGRAYYSVAQGSGFVYNFTGQMMVITNYHVVEGATNITMTFVNGDAYAMKILGTDPYEDLAVLSGNVPQSEWKPLSVVSSSTLVVGDSVIAIGNPYGLAGSMTVGIVSALGRTITEQTTSGYPIAGIIQTSTPINPGNSGGPLLNYDGQVVGITTAIISNSQGLGFAIPSNAILREIPSLVTTGSYNQHPSLGATGTDMTYEIAKAMNTNVTYGWLVATVSGQNGLHGGTKQVVVLGSTVTIGGDIVIGINGTRVRNIDDLSTYLEEHTSPGQTVDVTIVRDNQTMTIPVALVARQS